LSEGIFLKPDQGWGYISVVEFLPSIPEDLGLISSTKKKKKKSQTTLLRVTSL
jgi:hypothetical protein